MLRHVLVVVLLTLPFGAVRAQAQTANELYVQAYKLEDTDPGAAIELYQRVLEEWPAEELAVKAIDRIDHLQAHAEPSMSPDELPAPQVTLDTSLGAITLELFPNEAPETVGVFLDSLRAGELDEKGFESARTHIRLELPRERPRESNELLPVEGTAWVTSRNFAGTRLWLGISSTTLPQQAGLTVFGRVVEGLETVEEIASIESEPPKLVRQTVEIRRVETGDDLTFLTSVGDFRVELLDDDGPTGPVEALQKGFRGGALSGKALRHHWEGTVAVRLPDDFTIDTELLEILHLARERSQEVPERLLTRVLPSRGDVSIEPTDSRTLLHFHLKDSSHWDLGERIAVGRVVDGMEIIEQIDGIVSGRPEVAQDLNTVVMVETTSVDLQNTRPRHEVVPECSDPSVLETALKVVSDLLWENSASGRALAVLAGGEPARREDIDNFTFEEVRSVGTFSNLRGRTCKASVYRWVLHRRQKIPTEYEVELLDRQPGRFHVNVYLDFELASFVN